MSRHPADPARTLAFRVLRAVTADGAYANLELASRLAEAGLSGRDAALATELVGGTCRSLGSYDAIIEAASGRSLKTLQPAVVDVLRLGTHQLLALRLPTHAAVFATVDLARAAISPRVTGVVNAILRKVAARGYDEWFDELARNRPDSELAGTRPDGELAALRLRHPAWIAAAFAEVLPADEVEAALSADNVPPVPHLVVRPGLAEVAELGGEPARFSPYGAYVQGSPGAVAAVAEGRAGVQDEGSQLVALALARAEAPDGPWLDLCAGPGGKAALLGGLARQRGERLLASEVQPHRALLVARALAAYPEPRPITIAADGRHPAWPAASFAKVMVDAPCSGLGALRRRPESRWRRRSADLDNLVPLQRDLLRSALTSAQPGGVVAYVTCSPHRRETTEVVAAVLADATADVVPAARLLPEVPDAALGDFVQLWPHRHGTDAMFLALLRRR